MRYPQLTAIGRTRPAAPLSSPLVAVAHGSADPRAAAVVSRLIDLTAARASRRGLRGLQARVAYLGHFPPSVPEVLMALRETAGGHGGRGDGQRRAVVLPLLLTAAYHSDTDLPRLLGEVSVRLPWLRISYGEPLGGGPGMLRALDRRLAEAGAPAARPGRPARTADPAETAVVLAAAGSSRQAARHAVARVAAAWRSARGWRAVIPAYASAGSPTPGQAVAALRRRGAPRVVVATYLLAPGVFADQVREQSLAAGAHAVSAPLGAAPEVADMLIERYLEADARPGTAILPAPGPVSDSRRARAG